MSRHLIKILLIYFFIPTQGQYQDSLIVDSTICCLIEWNDFKTKPLLEQSMIWKYMVMNCPHATKRTYIYGEKTYKNLILEEDNSERREGLIDTLLLNYDLRLEYFKDSAQVFYRKAVAILHYRKSEIKTAYYLLKEAIRIDPYVSDQYYIVFMIASNSMLEMKEISVSEYTDNRKMSLVYLSEIKENNPYTDIQKTINYIEDHF